MGKTSWQVKAKYNAKNYRSITVQLPIELVERFDAKVKQEGISKTDVFRKAILDYLGESAQEGENAE